MTDGRSFRFTRFLENTALLRLLSDAPYPSSISHPTSLPYTPTTSRALPLDLERGIATAVAYLAGISQNWDHVIAACVEETPGKQGLVIRLAINKGKPDDGQELLEQIMSGLRDVFGVLARVGSDFQVPPQEYVARTILRLCRPRILQYIGSRRPEVTPLYADAPGTWLGKTLKTVSDIVAAGIPSQRIKPNNHPVAQSFVAISNNLESLLVQLEACGHGDVDDILLRVIVAASKLLGKFDNLPSLLRKVSEQELPSSVHQSLKRRLEELEGYSRCWLYLFEVAEKTTFLKGVTITSISLDESCFNTPAIAHHSFSLDACIARHTAGHKVSAATLTKNLRKPLEDARKEFTTIVGSAIYDSKIHAEIQVLTHYHLYPTNFPPRVIGSSKNACYLCNMLVGLHGQYATYGTHGRLYTKWRLPNLAVFDNLLDTLNRNLESQISLISRDVSWRTRLVVDYPYENPLLFLKTPISIAQEKGSGANPSATEDNDFDQTDIRGRELMRTLKSSQGVKPVHAPMKMLHDNDRASDSDVPTNWVDIYRARDSIASPLPETIRQPTPSTQRLVIKLRPTAGNSDTADLLKMFTDFVCGKGSELQIEGISDEEAVQALREGKIPMLDIQSTERPAQSEETQEYILLRHGDNISRMRVTKS